MQESWFRIQGQRNLILAASLVIALMIGGFAFWQWQEARFHQKRAEKQKELALDAVNILTYDLVDELAQIPRTTRIVTRIREANARLLEEIHALDPDTRKARREKASNLSRLGNSWLVLGKTEKALKAFGQTMEISRKLAGEDPENTEAQQDLAFSYERIGDVNLRTGNTDAALKAYEQEFEILNRQQGWLCGQHRFSCP